MLVNHDDMGLNHSGKHIFGGSPSKMFAISFHGLISRYLQSEVLGEIILFAVDHSASSRIKWEKNEVRRLTINIKYTTIYTCISTADCYTNGTQSGKFWFSEV